VLACVLERVCVLGCGRSGCWSFGALGLTSSGRTVRVSSCTGVFLWRTVLGMLAAVLAGEAEGRWHNSLRGGEKSPTYHPVIVVCYCAADHTRTQAQAHARAVSTEPVPRKACCLRPPESCLLCCCCRWREGGVSGFCCWPMPADAERCSVTNWLLLAR
jgi:hypothetical protein